MGQAPQIKDLAKLHDENVAFLKKITDNIQQTVSADIAKFRDGTKQFYDNQKLDYMVITQNLNIDFKQESDFSLGKIAEMITGISNVLFGTPQPADQDPDVKSSLPAKPVNAGADAMALLTGYQGLAVQAAVAVVNSVLSLFATSTSETVERSETRKQLAPGLMLHMFSLNQSFKSESAFNNESIFTTGFSFEVIYSKDQQALLTDIEYMTKMEASVNDELENLKLLRDRLHALIANPDSADERISAARKSIDDSLQAVHDQLDIIHNHKRRALLLLHM